MANQSPILCQASVVHSNKHSQYRTHFNLIGSIAPNPGAASMLILLSVPHIIPIRTPRLVSFSGCQLPELSHRPCHNVSENAEPTHGLSSAIKGLQSTPNCMTNLTSWTLATRRQSAFLLVSQSRLLATHSDTSSLPRGEGNSPFLPPTICFLQSPPPRQRRSEQARHDRFFFSLFFLGFLFHFECEIKKKRINLEIGKPNRPAH